MFRCVCMCVCGGGGGGGTEIDAALFYRVCTQQ